MTTILNLKDNLGHWNYIGKDYNLEDLCGFTYLAVNKTKDKAYVGKKQFWFFKRNSTRKTRVSNWRNYRSSSSDLLEEIKNGDEVEFHILGVFTSKDWCTYTEAFLHMNLQVLTRRNVEGDRLFYNRNVPEIKFVPRNDKSQYKVSLRCLTKARRIIREHIIYEAIREKGGNV